MKHFLNIFSSVNSSVLVLTLLQTCLIERVYFTTTPSTKSLLSMARQGAALAGLMPLHIPNKLSTVVGQTIASRSSETPRCWTMVYEGVGLSCFEYVGKCYYTIELLVGIFRSTEQLKKAPLIYTNLSRWINYKKKSTVQLRFELKILVLNEHSSYSSFYSWRNTGTASQLSVV